MKPGITRSRAGTHVERAGWCRGAVGPLCRLLVGGCRVHELTKVDPIVEPRLAEVYEVGSGPRHPVHVNLSLDRSHGRLEGRYRVRLAPVRIGVGRVTPFAKDTTHHTT